MKALKIWIIDDHDLLLRGLAEVLKKSLDIVPVRLINTGPDLLNSLASELAPDMLLLDVNLGDTDPEELLQNIRKITPELPILYLTILRGLRLFHRLEKHGIQGYVLKDIAYAELIDAIKIVAKGGTYISQNLGLDFNQDKAIHDMAFLSQPENNLLSPREKEILKLICQEYSNSQIADKLFISVKTVDTHRQNILIKLGVNNTVGLVKYAIQNHLV